MIGGIFETIGKTLGVGKENYFLELDDAAEDTVKGIEKVVAKAPEVAKEVASEVTSAAEAAVETSTAAAEAVAETAATAGKAVEKKVEKAAKNTAAKATAKSKAPEKAAAPAKAAPAAPDPNDIITSAIAAGARKRSGNAVGPNGEVQNFSTTYLMPKKKMSRRRPGPSLSGFKGMAKAVNPRLK